MKSFILIGALLLASCGAQPLRTPEEAAASAVADAVQANQEVNQETASQNGSLEQPTAKVSELLTVEDSLTGCQYLSINGGGLTPRVRFAYRDGAQVHYEHLGCTEAAPTA